MTGKNLSPEFKARMSAPLRPELKSVALKKKLRASGYNPEDFDLTAYISSGRNRDRFPEDLESFLRDHSLDLDPINIENQLEKYRFLSKKFYGDPSVSCGTENNIGSSGSEG